MIIMSELIKVYLVAMMMVESIMYRSAYFHVSMYTVMRGSGVSAGLASRNDERIESVPAWPAEPESMLHLPEASLVSVSSCVGVVVFVFLCVMKTKKGSSSILL
jgi:hypothetical protein